MPNPAGTAQDPGASLPEGTLTFLFTDIQGSTKLLQQLGEHRYGEVLAQHHSILREVLAGQNGIEVGTEGDAFFVVFRQVSDAVNAALRVQRKLRDNDWGSDIEVEVRMGIHTGEARRMGDRYVGIDVHRAARIAGAAHGRQILISRLTAEHVRSSSTVEPGIRLRDLGPSRLKDLEQPEHLFQLSVDGLPDDFPPPSALDHPVELPQLSGTFVPREKEQSEIVDLLRTDRLVTLTGPGGTGKTRLAVEVAKQLSEDCSEGTFFVPLAPIADHELVAATIAKALGIREVGTRPIVDSLLDFFSDREVLLILDNFEHVIDAAPVVSSLLTHSTRLRILVTSRASLHVSGEQEYPIPPMSVPVPARNEGPEQLLTYESITLFEHRARDVRPGFSVNPSNAKAVAEICARLDGLPLAIELAAAKSRFLTPTDIAGRLEDALTLLEGNSRDRPARQQTLRNAIAWSYGLLTEEAQGLLRTLGIFSGGWTLEAAEAVCPPESALKGDLLQGMETLVDNSLVVMREDDITHSARFVMLQTIREFALECLGEVGESEDLRRRHALYFLDLARRAGENMFVEGMEWPDRLEVEHDNLRAALRWAKETRNAAVGLELATCMWRFWQVRSHLAEGRAQLSELLEMDEAREHPLRAPALNAIGGLAYWQNDFEATRRYYQEAHDAYSSLDDPAGLAESLHNLGFLSLLEHRPDEALETHRRSLALFEQLGDESGVAYSKWANGLAQLQCRDLDEARRMALEAKETFDRLENWFGQSLAEFILHQVERMGGNHEGALRMMIESLDHPGHAGDISSMLSLIALLADSYIALGDAHLGLQLAAGAEKAKKEYGGGAPPELLELGDPKELARAQLSDEDIEAAWEEGWCLSLDETIALARKGSEGSAAGPVPPASSG